MIVHAFSDYVPQMRDTFRRMMLARETWKAQRWIDRPVHDEEVRLFTDNFGKVPYIKDVINAASDLCEPQDIVIFTNSDICCRTDTAERVASTLQNIAATFCFRRDFRELNTPIPDAAIQQGSLYAGSDLKAFRVFWWRSVRDRLPDMLLAREAWDAVFRTLIQETHSGADCESRDLIYHERHGSVWEDARNRYSIPSQLHNLRLAKVFFAQRRINPRTFGIP